MKTLLLNLACMSAVFTSVHAVGITAETVFEGDWQTTNRKLDGKMTCVVTDLGSEKWRGRFYGIWQAAPSITPWGIIQVIFAVEDQEDKPYSE